VHDLAGRLVRTLMTGTALAQGVHAANWNGRDDLNAPVAAGVYFYTLRTPTTVAAKRMTLVK
jgi:flagellar hook assembly protein FlgD